MPSRTIFTTEGWPQPRYNDPKSLDGKGGAWMRAYGLRLPVVLTALVLALAALFGLQAVYAQQTFAGPLATKLEHVAGVQGVPQVIRTGSGLQITVHLGLVPDLQSTYQDLEKAAAASVGGRAFALAVKGDRSPQLVQDYQQLSFVLDQARATGQFDNLPQQVQTEAKALGLQSASVSASQSLSLLFVTLVQGKSYLYAVMPLMLTTSGGGAA